LSQFSSIVLDERGEATTPTQQKWGDTIMEKLLVWVVIIGLVSAMGAFRAWMQGYSREVIWRSAALQGMIFGGIFLGLGVGVQLDSGTAMIGLPILGAVLGVVGYVGVTRLLPNLLNSNKTTEALSDQ
jgi:hypothetical protein